MKFTTALVTAGFALASTPALAGFQNLPSSGTLRVYGINNILVDPLFITQGAATGGTGTLPFIDPFTFALPTNFTLLASRSTVFELPITELNPITDTFETEFEEVGTFHDAVFRDTTDNKLVFGSRITMHFDVIRDPDTQAFLGISGEGEINDIFRYGLWGDDVQAGWTFVTSDDNRLFSAVRSANSTINPDALDTFDPYVVGLASDINVEEGAPVSGWFFVKTGIAEFALVDGAVGLFQAGEEGQEPFQARIAGFAPVPVPAAVWLLGSALVGVAGVARRRG